MPEPSNQFIPPGNQQATESPLSDAEYQATMGTTYIELGDYDKAIAAFQKAIELDPTSAINYRNLGYAYAQRGQYDEATVAYQRAVSLNIKQATYHFALGRTHARKHRYDEASAAYQKAQALAQSPEEQVLKARVWRRLGLTWLRRAEIEIDQRTIYLAEASRTFEQALILLNTLKPDPMHLARLHYDLGRCYAWQGRWQTAREQLLTARQIFTDHKARPELARTLLELGQLYHNFQEFDDAYAHLKDALRLFQKLEDQPGQVATQEALGNLLLQVGRATEAAAYLQTARHYYATHEHTQRLQEVDELLDIAAEAQPSVMMEVRI